MTKVTMTHPVTGATITAANERQAAVYARSGWEPVDTDPGLVEPAATGRQKARRRSSATATHREPGDAVEPDSGADPGTSDEIEAVEQEDGESD